MKKQLLSFIFLFILSSSFLYAQSTNFEKDLKKADTLLFASKRTAKELAEALTILERLNKEEDIRIKAHPREHKNFRMMLNYAYALYFKAAYTYPRETEPNGKDFFNIRLKFYRQGEALADELLKYKIEDKDTKAEAMFTAGMIKGEIASITSSPFQIVKGRNLLEAALKVSPKIRNGAIYLGLGRMYAKTPRILFGNQEKSLELLKKAETDFPFPNVVAFYFMAETILDGEDFDKAKPKVQIAALENLRKALEWEAKRSKIPVNKPNALTPEELDSLRVVRELLVKWKFPTDLTALKIEINKLKSK